MKVSDSYLPDTNMVIALIEGDNAVTAHLDEDDI